MADLSCTLKLPPPKSKPIYDKEYNFFNNWRTEKKVGVTTENVLLAYYEELSSTKKSSTLWASYSMLRSCLNAYENIDISKFVRLQAFLKQQSDGYEPKKSKILERDQINQFIHEADDLIYLAVKVILIMGYSGALRRDELTKMSTDDIKFRDNVIYVSVPITKTKTSRLFVISNEYWITLIKKYISLRPNGAPPRFFLTYRNGRCIKSPIGINKISQAPKIIASHLKLCNPEQYTGHCFRRSSASHLANQGSDLVTIKIHGGLKSSTVAESYIEESLHENKDVPEMFSSISSQPSTSTSTSSQPSPSISCGPFYPARARHNKLNRGKVEVNVRDAIGTSFQQSFLTQNLPGFSFNNSSRVSINVYNNCTISGEKEQRNS